MKKIITILMLGFTAGLFAQTWKEPQNGSKMLKADGSIFAINSDKYGNVFAAGDFKNGSGERYVARWTGWEWSESGKGCGDLKANNSIYALIYSVYTNDFYVGGDFTYNNKRYVSWGGGNGWSELGSNTLNAGGAVLALTMDSRQEYIYAAGRFLNNSGKNYVARCYKFNNSVWSEVGDLKANNTIHSLCSDKNDYIYAAGAFNNINGEQYVAKWDGKTWSELGNLKADSDILSICTDFAGKIYAAGKFKNASGKTYVAKWNGSTWEELGTGNNALDGNGDIHAIAVDKAGNVYAAGKLKNASQKYYVAKWNGAAWSELGSGSDALNANGYINALHLDKDENVYVGGEFTNAQGYRYVAQYMVKNLGIQTQESGNAFQVYPNPASTSLSIKFDGPGSDIVKMYNILGEQVYESLTSSNGNLTIDVSTLAHGVYVLKTSDYSVRVVVGQ